MLTVRAAVPATVGAAALVVLATVSGCASAAADVQVGDCVQLAGTQNRPEAIKVECGSPQSNFKVAATVDDIGQCPADVDTSYSRRGVFGDAGQTVCMDIDWVVGDCMSVDPQNDRDPARVDCADGSAPHRQRATQILPNAASVDQCVSGVGYAYAERQFTVCVENVR